MKIGEYFVQKGFITREQLDAALQLQKDNPEILLGHVMVTQDLLTKDQLNQAVADFLRELHRDRESLDEWLSQEQVDELIQKYS